MRNNAWVALAIVGIIIAFMISSSGGGSGAGMIDVQENGATIVNNTSVLDFQSPFNVTDAAGTAEIDLPLANDNIFIGNASGQPSQVAIPDCDLKHQAITYDVTGNAVSCQFIPTSYIVPQASAHPWSLPGYSCLKAPLNFFARQNDIIYGLIVPPETTTYVAIAIHVTVAGAGGTVARLGIYEADETATGWNPGALVVDAGTVSIATTGGKSIAIGETLDRGRPYFVALVHNSATGIQMTACNDEQTLTSPLSSRVESLTTDFLNRNALAANGIGTGAFSATAAAPDEMIGTTFGTAILLSE